MLGCDFWAFQAVKVLLYCFLADGLIWQTACADVPFVKVAIDGHYVYVVQDISEKSETKGWISEDMQKRYAPSALWIPSLVGLHPIDSLVRSYLKCSQVDPTNAFPYLTDAWKGSERVRALENARNEIGLVIKHYDEYQRQYVGIVTQGHKRIMCNFFLPQPSFLPDPLSRYISVNDGGYGFWHLEYDMKTHACMNLQINGPWEHDW